MKIEDNGCNKQASGEDKQEFFHGQFSFGCRGLVIRGKITGNIHRNKKNAIDIFKKIQKNITKKNIAFAAVWKKGKYTKKIPPGGVAGRYGKQYLYR